MNPGARRLARLLFCTIACATKAAALAADEDAVSKLSSDDQKAYAQRRDLIPSCQKAIHISSIAEHVDGQSIKPDFALGGRTFLASDDSIIQLAGVQGGLSTERIRFAGVRTRCPMVSLASTAATFDNAEAAVGNVFPCHVHGRNVGAPTARFAKGSSIENGAIPSLSAVHISKGMVLAARNCPGRALFPDNGQAEKVAQKATAGQRVNVQFAYPYGQRYCANPCVNWSR